MLSRLFVTVGCWVALLASVVAAPPSDWTILVILARSGTQSHIRHLRGERDSYSQRRVRGTYPSERRRLLSE